MPHTITIGTEPDGRPVALKSALDPAAAERLAAEADRLRLVPHPAVVEVVRFDEVAGVLATAWAPGGSLATADVSLTRAAAALAAAATALVEVHERGLAHGRIDATHLLLGPAGQTWLTGFAPPPTPGTAEQDTVALGALITEVLATAAGTSTPRSRTVPPRPGARTRPALPVASRRRAGATASPAGGLAADLRHVATRIADPVHPATDREVARALREAVERAEAGRHQGQPATSAPRQRTAVMGAAALAMAVILGAGAWWLLRPSSGPTAPMAAAPESTPTAAPTTSDPAPTSTSTTAPAPPATRRCVTVAPPAADVDADGCPEALRLEGGVVRAGHLTLRLATGPDDVVRLGDWTCAGRTTVAVVRQGGAIEVFDGWATPERPVVARPVVDEPLAVDIEPPAGDGPCTATVVLADGERRPTSFGVAR